jgi:FAD:protein FMN transferase
VLPTDIRLPPVEGGPTSEPSPARDVVAEDIAMASRITIRVAGRFVAAGGDPQAAIDGAFAICHAVDRECTRFDNASDLMRANATPSDWTSVGVWCFDAVAEAFAAYQKTNGRFDPRVLDDLVRLGYEHSFSAGGPDARTREAALQQRPPLSAWQPELRPVDRRVRLAGPEFGTDQARHRIDLGGIGKGLAVRWAATALHDAGISDYIIEAGGDCYCAGRPTEAPQWRVGVEDPRGGSDPVAVLSISHEAIATSSTRLRHWDVEGIPVHHLIDPASGRPGGAGLSAVTVVGSDPAMAEVWSKVLFLAGADGIAREVERLRLPALWVHTDGSLGASPFLGSRLLWRAS